MGKGAPWESWAWDVPVREAEGNGAPGVQTRERGQVGKWQGRGNAGRNMPGTPTIIGGANAGRGPCSRGAGRTCASGLACLPEHSGPLSVDSASDSGPSHGDLDSSPSCEDSDLGLPGLLSPATPTLWWELPGPVIPLFPGSMAKLNMAKSRGALSPAIPCVGVENEAKGHFMGRSSTEMAQNTRKICILCLYLCISLTTKYTLGENNIGRFLACFVSTNDLAVQ